MNSTIEEIILRNLQYNEDYARKVLPYLKSDYFVDFTEKQYFVSVQDYFEKFDALPSNDALHIEFSKLKTAEDTVKGLMSLSETLKTQKEDKTNSDWLLEETENFCKDKALYLAINESIMIADGKNENLSTTAIPDLLAQALAVSFDTNIGHDYLLDSTSRLAFYKQKKHKIAFHLSMMNTITNQGAERKTANCIAAGTGIGKSMMLCDMAANYIKDGLNVLYITLEMAEEKIAQRIDANLLNVAISDIEDIEEEVFDKKIEKLKTQITGKLKIKEYPTSSAHVGHFRHLLRELKQKQQFKPDVVIIDYMNICSSARFKDKSNSYGFIKSVCEELRGFAVQENVCLWTATQLNRDGIDNSDADMKNISESMGGPMTFDFLFALISNEELAALNQVLVKQLKNRYGDVYYHNKFTIGVDRAKMKFYDLNNSGMSATPLAPVTQQKTTQISSGNSVAQKTKQVAIKK